MSLCPIIEYVVLVRCLILQTFPLPLFTSVCSRRLCTTFGLVLIGSCIAVLSETSVTHSSSSLICFWNTELSWMILSSCSCCSVSWFLRSAYFSGISLTSCLSDETSGDAESEFRTRFWPSLCACFISASRVAIRLSNACKQFRHKTKIKSFQRPINNGTQHKRTYENFS